MSEGRDQPILAALTTACGAPLLDVHSDAEHNRSVFTLGGEPDLVEKAVRQLARAVVEHVDLSRHAGAHPRLGALDVVPWVALEGWPLRDAATEAYQGAHQARDRFARWAATELGLPSFLYGPERSLPEVRAGAWGRLSPDVGPQRPHPTAGAVCAGVRPLMVAYNLWMADADLAAARALAAAIRSPAVRALAFTLAGQVQVSCNLVQPMVLGPAEVWDQVALVAPVSRAELVGLVPWTVLDVTPRHRWEQLDLGLERTIEARLVHPRT